MRLPLGIATSIMLLVAGCDNFSTSKMNPVNWFSGSAKVEMMEAPPADAGDPRPLVDEVLSMVVEPTSGGAIVRATGRTPTQGWWVAELVPEEEEPVDGRMTYRFVIAPPLQSTRVSTPASCARPTALSARSSSRPACATSSTAK